MRASLPSASAVLVAAGALVVACSSHGDDALHVSFAPTILAPRDVLTNAVKVTLVVYDTKSGVTCNATTGKADGATASTTQVGSATLTKTCAAGSGGEFCGALTITESDAQLVFEAEAFASSGSVLAYGCSTATVNQASESLSIKEIRNVPPAVCGDGIIESTEQCDPPPPDGGVDAVCDSQCHSQEETLSIGTNTPQGPTFLLWPAQKGAGGQLMAFFTDANAGGQKNKDVALRVMDDSLEPVSTPAAVATAIIAPNDPNIFPPTPAPGNQSQPAAAVVLGTYFYVFTDDSTNNDPDIHMRSFDSSFAALQSVGAPIGINGTNGAGEPNQQVAPTVAVNGTGTLFVAWQDVSGPTYAGQVVGRTYAPTGGALGTESQISIGSGNENVQLAGTPTGWVAVWDDGKQIYMRTISGNGTPSGPQTVVSATGSAAKDHPGIAVLSDGRFAVVWADHGSTQGTDIYVQRYDANSVPVAHDADTPINDQVTTGDQITPVIAGTSAANGSFVAAWLDSSTGHVRGRILDGTTGFDFNPVDGTSSEFQASLASGVTRENPTVAVGGAQPWIAIGWDVGGVVSARRFPTSTQTQ